MSVMIFSNIPTSDYGFRFIALYIIQGIIIVIVNLVLVFRVFSNRNLRAQKEFVIIGSCLFFDIIFGLTYFSAGIFRAFVVFSYKYFPLVSQWECFLTPHIQLFIIITIMAGIILLMTAIDRFICVFFPIKYMKLQVEYAYSLMFLPYLIIIPLWVPAAKTSANDPNGKNYTMTCKMIEAMGSEIYEFYRRIRILTTISCIIIYVPIFFKMRINIKNHAKIAPRQSASGKKLLSMTKTVALISASTLFLFTIPDIITYFSPFIETNLLYWMNLNKGFLNIIIFLLTQKTLQQLLFPSQKRRTSDTISHPTRINGITVINN